jgi:tRNA G18 (ribose-2'-O)-methylase SpoU
MSERVASLDDPRLAPYRHVGDPVWLRKHGLFVAEGRLVVERLLALPGRDVHSLLVTPAAFAALADQLSSIEPVYVSDRKVLEAVTGFNFHRGCLALAARPALTTVESLVEAPRLLALDGVGNPDNVGGLFRTAAAFGVTGVLLSGAAADPLYRKAIRTSMGSALFLPFARAKNWREALQLMRRHGLRIVALTPDARAAAIDPCANGTAGDRWVLVVGAEGAGLSRETLASADLMLRIPIVPSVDSLNVVVAAGIALHALTRHAVTVGH